MGRIQGDLLERSFAFGVSVMDLIDALPSGAKGWMAAKQLAGSGPAVGAIVQEAHHAFTRQDFAYKCNTALKEADETHYWLRLAKATRLLTAAQVDGLMAEAAELVRILAAIVKKTQTPPKVG
ncbi:MAG: four helix bundle protein [Phycisphaerales bacterium]|nr:four helix bundle protein [Phycisphaerales bacterium]